jgi:hypothetical protein
MNLTLWIVQGLLAFAFIAVGSLKLFAYEKFKAQSEKKGPVGITRGLAAFIGAAEIVGGLGIVLPMATNIVPALSLWAALGLSNSQRSCCWPLAITCAATSRQSRPASFSCLQCVCCPGVFLTGSKEGARRCFAGSAWITGKQEVSELLPVE